MDQIIAQFGSAVSDFFGNPIVRTAGQVIFIYVVVIWLAAAYWAYRDLQPRTTNPVAPYLAAALIIVFTPIFFVFGVIVYRILRPRETGSPRPTRGPSPKRR